VLAVLALVHDGDDLVHEAVESDDGLAGFHRVGGGGELFRGQFCDLFAGHRHGGLPSFPSGSN
jgi:hypothetical protein